MVDSPPPLLLGAAGFLGMNIAQVFLDAGVRPVCARRRRTNVLALRRLGLPMVAADLADGTGVADAFAGHRVVIHAAAHYPKLSLHPEDALRTGLAELECALDAAAVAGVRRFVFVSSTATVAPRRDGPSTEVDTFPTAPDHGTYHRLKWHLEQRVLAETRFEVRVVCPGACLGPWDLRVGTSALLMALARGLDPDHPDGWVNLVDARDVGRAVVALSSHREAPRRVLLAGSSWRLHALLASLAPRYGRRRPRAPLTPAQAIALADAEERAAFEHGGRARLSREIVDLVIHGTPIDASLATRSLGLRWTPLADTLADWEAWARRLRLLEPLEVT